MAQANTSAPSKAIVYCRVSTPKQAGDVITNTANTANTENTNTANTENTTNTTFTTFNTCASFEAQERVCREYCSKNNLTIKSVIRDVCSGFKYGEQERLELAVEDLEEGDYLVVYDVDRFTRNIERGLRLLRELNTKKAFIYAVNDVCGYETLPDKQRFRQMLIQAQAESERKSDKIKACFREHKSRGSFLGKAPFGQSALKTREGIRKLEKNVTEQQIIKDIISMANENEPTCRIADMLNKKSILCRKRLWTSYKVKNIIKTNNVFNTHSLSTALGIDVGISKKSSPIKKIVTNKNTLMSEKVNESSSLTNRTSRYLSRSLNGVACDAN